MKKFSLFVVTSNLLLAILLLSGCTTVKFAKPKSTISPSSPTTEAIQAFTIPFSIKGKLGVSHNHQGTNAHLDWQQNQENYLIKLSGPLGQGRLEISGDATQATVVDQKGKYVKVDSIEEFLHKKLGWHLPINSWSYWIRGSVAPSTQFQATYYENGQLKTLAQYEWY